VVNDDSCGDHPNHSTSLTLQQDNLTLSHSRKINRAILAGEKFVLEQNGHLNNIKALINRTAHSVEIAQLLANSFGGAVEDHFVETRLKEMFKFFKIFKIFKYRYSGIKAQKGFGVLVNALSPLTQGTKKCEIKQVIAREIGAKEGDLIVSNLAKRILVLRNKKN
jgi:hypothetical protein